MNQLNLTEKDQALLRGEMGSAGKMSMRILVAMAKAYGATEFLDIESAHIDGCLYHGDSGLEFAERLVQGNGQVVVPTTLNVGSVDLLHPEAFQGTAVQAERGARTMKLYEEMGCKPIYTCTPYQAMHRPNFGSQIMWAESNAIVFANSVLGARTNRYGDFIDICGAITGRAPAFGLHLTENRRATRVYSVEDLPKQLFKKDVFYPVLGYFLGLNNRQTIPAVIGLPDHITEDQLKILGAASASSGALALFHIVGKTPEALTLNDACQGELPAEIIKISMDDIRESLAHLSTVPDGPINVVAFGSPHFSLDEFAQLMPLLETYPIHPNVQFMVCTNRLALTGLKQRGWLDLLREMNVQIVVDTCVVVAPLVKTNRGTLMTNSGKFAHYTPGNTGLNVIFGSMEECVRSAALGTVWRDDSLWLD
ncbi:MAG: aconitase X catalytic domain-containing protein [Chloroflexota bacterium]